LDEVDDIMKELGLQPQKDSTVDEVDALMAGKFSCTIFAIYKSNSIYRYQYAE
jgi:hypothetical protein